MDMLKHEEMKATHWKSNRKLFENKSKKRTGNLCDDSGDNKVQRFEGGFTLSTCLSERSSNFM